MRFRRDASNRLTFDLDLIDASEYPAICRDLIRKFDLSPDGEPVVGLHEKLMDACRGDDAVGLDWDHWMKFTIVAKSPAAEPLVREMADWLLAGRWGRIVRRRLSAK